VGRLASCLKQETDVQNILIGNHALSMLSPMQQAILLELSLEPLTLEKLSKRTGKSIYSLGKQLSLLQMRTKYNPLQSKGITRPLVQKHKDFGVRTTYSLACAMVECANKRKI